MASPLTSPNVVRTCTGSAPNGAITTGPPGWVLSCPVESSGGNRVTVPSGGPLVASGGRRAGGPGGVAPRLPRGREMAPPAATARRGRFVTTGRTGRLPDEDAAGQHLGERVEVLVGRRLARATEVLAHVDADVAGQPLP